MTTTVGPRQAQLQASIPADELLHSANSGMIIHRRGQLDYEFAAEGRSFSVDLLSYVNQAQAGVATTFCYEEVFGTRERLNWFIHMKTPNDYQKLLEMVDHDREFQSISDVDRLPEKGHGNWDKMFLYGSLGDRILVPQHGIADDDHDDDHPLETFVPPAACQLTQPPELQLNSANAGAIVLRNADLRYEFRKEGRIFAFDWQNFVNERLAGQVTALLYEQTWGQQDRIHHLIHLRSLDDYQALAELDRSDEMAEKIYAKQRVHESKGGGTWDRVFVPASIRDTLLIPHAPSNSSK